MIGKLLRFAGFVGQSRTTFKYFKESGKDARSKGTTIPFKKTHFSIFSYFHPSIFHNLEAPSKW